jgi:hypothetical protein
MLPTRPRAVATRTTPTPALPAQTLRRCSADASPNSLLPVVDLLGVTGAGSPESLAPVCGESQFLEHAGEIEMRGNAIVVAAWVMTAGTAFGQVNILENPGFETGSLDPWYQLNDFGGPENWNVTDADAHTGAFCATDVGNKLIVQDFDPTPVADILETSFWIKQPEIAISAVYFAYSDGSSAENLVFLTTADWQFFDVTGLLAPGKNLTTFGLYGYIGGGEDEDRSYVDDWTVSIEGQKCPADCNGDGTLNILDFICFQGIFQAGNPDADCNGDGSLNILDFVCFQGIFQEGCP